MIHCSAPGSLLLAGEYRITERGGRGVAMAGGGRAVLTGQHAPAWRIQAEPEGILSSPWKPGMEGLANHVWELLPEFNIQPERKYEAVLDSHTFFDSGGKKLGLGSSAAASLLFSCLMGQKEARRSTIIKLALCAHRAWQNGRGSGYDVLCSAHGGVGMFTGGTQPLWEGLKWPKGLEYRIFQGRKPVSSREAVDLYTAWRETKVSEWRKWERVYNREFEGFLEALCREDKWAVLDALGALGRLGVELGEMIGVCALPQLEGMGGDLLSGGRKGLVLKSLGAGNETVLAVSLPGELKDTDIEGFVGVQRQIHPGVEGLLRD